MKMLCKDIISNKWRYYDAKDLNMNILGINFHKKY